MKRKKFLLLILFLIGCFLVISNVKADDTENVVNSNEYNEWSLLSEEDVQMCSETDMYVVPESTYVSSNPLKLTRMALDELETSYTLQDIIEENLVIKNQGTSPSCWAYAILSSLETNLALRNLFNNSETVLYDFSEMHVEYATTREFLNGEINEKGYNIGPFQLGMFRRAISYLTNGFGAVDESSMPFEEYCKDCVDTESKKIELSEIMNKDVTAQVNDTIEFPTYDVTDDNMENIENLKMQLKKHIKIYGGVSAGVFYTRNIHHVYFNYDNSAFYCDDITKCSMNHAVTIVGWDDDFAVTNFGSSDVAEEERIRPSNPGAWIVKNSYGTEDTYTFDEIREIYCTVSRNVSICKENGWDKDSSLIPKENINELIEYNRLISDENGIYSRKIGEEGFYYISYEDARIYKDLFGILDASTDITYDSIYQYNELGWNYLEEFNTENGKLYLANVFEKGNSDDKEYLTQVSLLVPETNTVSVYINPNGSDLNKDSLELVELKSGVSETFDAGYHTLEFLKPIEIVDDEFAVVVEIQEVDIQRQVDTSISVRLEGYSETVSMEGFNTSYFKIPGIADGRCFYSTNMTDWSDFSEYVLDETKAETNTNYIGADTTIKAFTISEIEGIEIVTPPDRTNYIEGDNFETSGMKVEAISSKGTRIEITNYTIEDGSNLEYGQDTVTINYLGKTQTQEVSVEKNTVESIEITTPPTTTEYIEGQSFNSDGMVVTATYKNGTSLEITNYKVIDGENLNPDKNNVTISYEEDGVNLVITQSITITGKTLQSITVEDDNVKKSYIEGQNFDKAGLVVIANYEYLDIELNNEEYEIIGGENLQVGSNEIIIRYEEEDISKEAKIEVEAIEKEVVSISIDQSPDKTEYIEGQNFDSKGMIVKAKFNDGDEKIVTEYVSIENGTNLVISQESVIVKYQGKEVIQNITVLEKQIESISIKQLPTKKTYIQNKEALDLTGGLITVNYDNGTSDDVDMVSNSVVVTGYDNTKIGSNSLILAYGGKTLEFSVEIKEDVVPINSNFENSIGNINSIKSYHYTTGAKNDYVLMETVVSKILKSDVNDQLEYYYYLSSNQEELNINNWVKIEKEQSVDSDIVSFVIDTNDIMNYDEVSTADVLYLYIKEVVTRENKQQTVISNALLLETNVEIEKYVDDVKYEGMGSDEDSFENPETGSFIFMFVVMVIAVTSLSYVRYYFEKQRSA